MIVRRIGFYNQLGASGGGPAPIVAWGPDFGGADGDSFNVNAVTMLPAVGLAHDSSIGIVYSLPFVASIFNAKSIGVDPDGSLGPFYANSIAVDPDAAAGATFNGQSVATQPAMPSLGFAGAHGAGVHQSGSVTGAPFLQATSTFTSTSATITSFDIPKPTGTAVGDVLVAVIGFTPNTVTITTPSGWSYVRDDAGAANCRMYLFTRVVDGSEGATISFATSAACAGISTMFRIAGANTTTPINVSGATVTNATDPVAPSITTTTANCLIVCACVQANLTNADYTAPANYTEQSDLNGNGALGALQNTGCTDTRILAAAGATGTATMDSTQLTSGACVALHFAVAPGPLTIAS